MRVATSHRSAGSFWQACRAPGPIFCYGQRFSLITVGLAVGAAWYLRNVAFPGEFVRAADSPTPRRGRARASRAARRRRRVAGTRHETWLAPNAPKSAWHSLAAQRQNTCRLPHKSKHPPRARRLETNAGKFGAKEEGHEQRRDFSEEYDNYYSGATDWDTAQQPRTTSTTTRRLRRDISH